ncbi:hypothetical protein GCM10009788_45510 [Nocardioides humi]|uniref:Uncharacterized protein n=1 Tax=Nocardioides humi TaxID=449461 RepID=A0ABN2BEP8_9ACTN
MGLAVAVRGTLARDRYDDRLVDAPAEAVAAYQRAATVINAAAPCNLDWLVLAAVGRLASNHGRGAPVGRPLNGRAGRDRVSDTDAGRLDGDPRWDAPVGPMGLLPETWARVAVDADGDAVRDVRDLDDAALGVAVLLCSDGEDLSRRPALRRALHLYDATPGLARTVLRLVAEYGAEPVGVPGTAPVVVPVVPVDLPELCDCPDDIATLARPHDIAVLEALVRAPVRQEQPAPAAAPADEEPEEPEEPEETEEPEGGAAGEPAGDPKPDPETVPTA